MKLLVVEDDDAIAEPLVEGLTRHGFDAKRVATGTEALLEKSFDFVLLDLGLPDMDGIDVCRILRENTTVPIIIISARGDESDRVLGLELGADDYITKPFGVRELVARIRAVQRRLSISEAPTTLTVGNIAIDLRTRKVSRAGTEIDLTAKEFELLVCLAEDPDAVVSRQDIIETVWDMNWYGPTKTLDVHMAALRKKLGSPDVIETVRGVGYRMKSA